MTDERKATIDDTRRQYLEERCIRDFETLAKARARRDKLIAAWAARTIGRADSQAYLEEVRIAGLKSPGDEDIVRKLPDDLDGTGQRIPEADPREHRAEMMFETAAAIEADEQSPSVPDTARDKAARP